MLLRSMPRRSSLRHSSTSLIRISKTLSRWPFWLRGNEDPIFEMNSGLTATRLEDPPSLLLRSAVTLIDGHRSTSLVGRLMGLSHAGFRFLWSSLASCLFTSFHSDCVSTLLDRPGSGILALKPRKSRVIPPGGGINHTAIGHKIGKVVKM